MGVDKVYDLQMEKYRESAKRKEQIVTVFMLTHNRENFLKKAIDAVLKQSYENFNFIILDNCSEDNTKELVSGYEDERVIYIYRESLPESSNTKFAFEQCITRYIIVLHDDDVIEPMYLERMVASIQESKCAAVSCAPKYIDENGEITFDEIIDYPRLSFCGNQYMMDYFSWDRQYFGMIYPATIYDINFYGDFDKFFLFPEAGPAADQLVWFQTCRFGGKLKIINEKLINYRRHCNQDSSINEGFIDIKLIDYLLNDAFYRPKLDEAKLAVIHKIWVSYAKILSKMYDKTLSPAKLKEVMNNASLQYLKGTMKGKCCYYVIKVFNKMPTLIGLLLRINHTI